MIAALLWAHAAASPSSLASLTSPMAGVRQCVVSRLGGGWLLTAAHCIPTAAKGLQLSCGGPKVPVSTVVRHPTHDVALLRAAAVESGCEARVVDVGAFAVDVEVPGATVVGRDDHVLRLKPTSGCWPAGRSGQPFVQAGRAVALLIGGPRQCEGVYTAVRLGPLLPWLDAARGAVPGG